MLDHYEHALAGFGPIGTMVELGIFHGGSAALFNELLRPKRLVAFDIVRSSPSSHFDRYVDEHPGVSAHWGVDQSDTTAVLAAVGPGPIDLVIDDASHHYDLTAATFDALFPRLRPGGLYIVEDWGWSFQERWTEHPELRCRRSMSDLLLDMAGVMISRPGVIARVEVLYSFVVIERGPAEVATMDVRGDAYRRSDYRRNRRIDAARRTVRGTARRARRLLRP
jgi:hypothetical protein